MNIVLTENLNLAVGMIALAERGPDGLPTEAGNLQIKAASIIASTLHDFDNGSSYGVAFGLLMDHAAKLGPSDMRLKVGVDRSSRDVYSALSISDAAIITDSIIGELADPSSRVGEIDRTHGSMDSIIPTRDLWDFAAEKIASEKLLYENIGVAAGDEDDDPATIFKDGEEDQAIDNLHTEAIELLGYKYSEVASDPEKQEKVAAVTKLLSYERAVLEKSETLSGSEKIFALGAAEKFHDLALMASRSDVSFAETSYEAMLESSLAGYEGLGSAANVIGRSLKLATEKCSWWFAKEYPIKFCKSWSFWTGCCCWR